MWQPDAAVVYRPTALEQQNKIVAAVLYLAVRSECVGSGPSRNMAVGIGGAVPRALARLVKPPSSWDSAACRNPVAARGLWAEISAIRRRSRNGAGHSRSFYPIRPPVHPEAEGSYLARERV